MILTFTELAEKHPKIVEIFPIEWFEKELKKEKNHIHPLAWEFHWERGEPSSLFEFNELEHSLSIISDEIQQNKSHFQGSLRKKEFYQDTKAEIEIASLFKEIGYSIYLEPQIVNSLKKIRTCDFRISAPEFNIFVEVSRIDPKLFQAEWEKRGNILFSDLKFYASNQLKNKIRKERKQLDCNNPTLLAVSFPREAVSSLTHICSEFYHHIKRNQDGTVEQFDYGKPYQNEQFPDISGYFIYCQSYGLEGNKIKRLCKNYYANIPLPEEFLQELKKSNITIIEK